MAKFKNLARGLKAESQKTYSTAMHLYGKSISRYVLLAPIVTAFILTVALTITMSPIVLYVQFALLILSATVEYGVRVDVPLSIFDESYLVARSLSVSSDE